MDDSMRRILIREALEARKNSFCPISGFAVGAALLAQNGEIYGGCNIECAGLSTSSCAERTAIFKAVSEGVRSFSAIAVAGGLKSEPLSEFCPPCGVCRQVMAQFCKLDAFRIIVAVDEDSWQEYTLGELLPAAFQRFQDKEETDE